MVVLVLVSVTHSLVYLTKSAGEARNGERALGAYINFDSASSDGAVRV